MGTTAAVTALGLHCCASEPAAPISYLELHRQVTLWLLTSQLDTLAPCGLAVNVTVTIDIQYNGNVHCCSSHLLSAKKFCILLTIVDFTVFVHSVNYQYYCDCITAIKGVFANFNVIDKACKVLLMRLTQRSIFGTYIDLINVARYFVANMFPCYSALKLSIF